MQDVRLIWQSVALLEFLEPPHTGSAGPSPSLPHQAPLFGLLNHAPHSLVTTGVQVTPEIQTPALEIPALTP